LKSNGEDCPDVQGGLFESIIQLICYTSDPLTENGQMQLNSNPNVVAETYHCEHIGSKENKGRYVPLSNIL
jgi:hypothetical protein